VKINKQELEILVQRLFETGFLWKVVAEGILLEYNKPRIHIHNSQPDYCHPM
jgi:hypothetical protein